MFYLPTVAVRMGKLVADGEVLCIGSRPLMLEDTLLGPARSNPLLEAALLGPVTPAGPLLADSCISCPACP